VKFLSQDIQETYLALLGFASTNQQPTLKLACHTDAATQAALRLA